MLYKEERRDIFHTDSSYALVHCIGADFSLGAGLSAAFRRMGVRDELVKNYPEEKFPNGKRWNGYGYCLQTSSGFMGLHDTICNLVIKENCFEKPTYRTMEESLEDLHRQCFLNDMTKLAMPMIGCGLDGLNWERVSEILKTTFQDTDIEILVCYR